MISINSNVSADRMTNMLSELTQNITKTSERIASGKRILSAADDPAGIAIASRLKYDNSSYSVVSKNINQGLSLIETSSKALESVTEVIGQMKNLAVEASSETLSADQRSALQSTFTELQTQLDDIVNKASIFGQNLIGTTAADVNIQSGINAGDSTTITSAATDAATLGVDAATVDLTSAANAGTAMTALDAALSTVGVNQSVLGAQQSGFEIRLSSIDNLTENLSAAVSRIEDADIAEESKKLSLLQTQQQMATQALAIANTFPQNALQLLR